MTRRYDNLWQTIERFRQDRHGGVLVFSAFMMSALIGFTGLAVDVGSWYGSKRNIQTAADAAAISAAFEMSRGETDQSLIKAAAEKDAKLNGSDVADGATVNVQIDTVNQSVTVVVTEEAPLYFSTLFLEDNPTIAARGTASVAASTACILALNSSAQDAIKINGGTLMAKDCWVHANSSHMTALDVHSGGVLDAEAITVVGDYKNDGTMTSDPQTGVSEISDPLAAMAAPEVGSCEYNDVDINSGSHTLSPGVYCGGLEFDSEAYIFFEPGLYIITGGKLKASGDVTLEGYGVTFYLDGKLAEIDFTGKSAVTLTAPTTGEYAGILFFADRDVTKKTQHKISGGGNMFYEGTIYAPVGDVSVVGNGVVGPQSPWTMIIADTFDFSGNGVIEYNSNYSSSDVPLPEAISGAGRVALTE